MPPTVWLSLKEDWQSNSAPLLFDSRDMLDLSKSDPYDSLLIEEAQDLCRTFNLTTKVRRLFWLDRMLWSKINSDECRFGADGVFCPDRMKGRLEPEEWKPIMASSLVFKKILVKNMPASYLIALPVLITVTLIGAGISTLLGNSENLFFLFFVLLVDGPILINAIARATKKRRLEADVVIARVLGRDQFLNVLSKIEGFGLDDVVKRTEKRGIGRHFSGKPSVPERIANLRAKT
jgi:hypothetical protein